MKKYTSPTLEYQSLEAIDILTTSGDQLVNDDSVNEWGENQ